MENFKKIGFSSDADNSYYQFRKMQVLSRKLENDPVTYLFDVGALIFYGYVKKPLYPLLWSLFSIAIFGAFWKMVGSRNRKSKIVTLLETISFMIIFYLLWVEMSSDKPELVIVLVVEILFFALFLLYSKKMELKESAYEIDEYNSVSNWPKSISNAVIFSATVFLSSPKLFVEPPPIPKLQGVSESKIKALFNMERLIGALFSILFFYLIAGMILKPV